MFLTLLLTLHGPSCEPNKVMDCLPERCKCFEINSRDKYYMADCSGKGLTFVPNFPDNITEINLSHNPLNYIHSTDNKNISSKLNSMDLSHCGSKMMERGFLRKFSNLTYLDISYNRELILEVLPNVTYDLQNTSIRTFKCDALHCEVGTPNIVRLDHLYYLQNTSLEEIHICSNRIEKLERGVIVHLPQTLQKITAADNRVKVGWYLLEVHSMKNLSFANLSTQYKSYECFTTWICSCQSVGTVNFILPFTTNVTISISILQTFSSWVATSHFRPPMAFLSHNLSDTPGLAPLMNVLFWGRCDFPISFSGRDMSGNVWNRL